MKVQKLSGRAHRMAHFKKLHGKSGLNLVSLMDIFTILVFFLLVSSSSVQQIPNTKKISLPTSVAEKAPKETIVIAITKSELLLEGVAVASIQDILNSNESVVNKLAEELRYHASKSSNISQMVQAGGRAVTIMGDEDIPYQLLRKILATCRQANYTQIAFAAVQKAKGKG
ncbi:MAG: biopolymer transporter ExbD [Gammaproteobacteria bacterium]|nr:biopolymer transporter ExbD [Gammaproteobacteria bacterium]